MKITADTNVLVRATVQDDKEQALLAVAEMDRAEVIAVPLSALCEFVWVLTRAYDFSRREVAGAVEALMAVGKVALDRPAAEAGLAVFKAGGDFADGVIAFEGRRLGGETFVSFDRPAVTALNDQGLSARLPD